MVLNWSVRKYLDVGLVLMDPIHEVLAAAKTQFSPNKDQRLLPVADGVLEEVGDKFALTVRIESAVGNCPSQGPLPVDGRYHPPLFGRQASSI